MKQYKAGEKFHVCTVEYLVDVLGWWEEEGYYYHTDFPDLSISPTMLKSEGQTLTVSATTYGSDWYGVEQNSYYWPVASFLSEAMVNEHTCIEGMTPIDGWFICKTCGTNLKEIK